MSRTPGDVTKPWGCHRPLGMSLTPGDGHRALGADTEPGKTHRSLGTSFTPGGRNPALGTSTKPLGWALNAGAVYTPDGHAGSRWEGRCGQAMAVAAEASAARGGHVPGRGWATEPALSRARSLSCPSSRGQSMSHLCCPPMAWLPPGEAPTPLG